MVGVRDGQPLPWGWWLRADDSALRDEDGRSWSTVRDAYWIGALGFPDRVGSTEEQERFLRALVSIAQQRDYHPSLINELFGGDRSLWNFYEGWLVSIGVYVREPSAYSGSLTVLGKSVMRMLQATRKPEWVALPLATILNELDRTRKGPTVDEAAILAFEQQASAMPARFGREKAGTNFLVTLTMIDVRQAMPLRRVVWGQSFKDERHRDCFFAWLANKVADWEVWANLAYWRGPSYLTDHLLKLLLTDRLEVDQP